MSGVSNVSMSDVQGELEWRRLDPRMLLIGPLHDLLRFAIPLALLFLGRGAAGDHWPTLIAAAVVVAFGMSRWFTTRYRISASQVEFRTGLLRRRSITVPLDRIRTVDVSARALHRLLGVATVSMGTGRRDRAKKDELHLAAVSIAEATKLRSELLHRRDVIVAAESGTGAIGSIDGGGQFVAAAADAPPIVRPVQTIVHLDPSWVRYAPFTTSGLFTLLAVIGFSTQYISEYHVDPSRIGPVHAATQDLSRLPRPLLAGSVLVGVLVVVAVLSTAGYLLAFWGFTLERHPEGFLQIQRGLLTRRLVSIEERRLRGVEVSEPILLRSVRGARTIAIATGLRVGRGSDRGGELLLPPAPRSQAHRVAAAVLRVGDPTTLPLIEHGRRARTRRYTRSIGVSLALVAGLLLLNLWGALPSWPWLTALVLIPVAALLARDRYRNLGHTMTELYLVSRVGSLARRTSALQRTGIIGWRIRESFFQRRVGLVTLMATTAGGRGRYSVPDIEIGEAVQLASAATPGLLVPFLAEAPAAVR